MKLIVEETGIGDAVVRYISLPITFLKNFDCCFRACGAVVARQLCTSQTKSRRQCAESLCFLILMVRWIGYVGAIDLEVKFLTYLSTKLVVLRLSGRTVRLRRQIPHLQHPTSHTSQTATYPTLKPSSPTSHSLLLEYPKSWRRHRRRHKRSSSVKPRAL